MCLHPKVLWTLEQLLSKSWTAPQNDTCSCMQNCAHNCRALYTSHVEPVWGTPKESVSLQVHPSCGPSVAGQCRATTVTGRGLVSLLSAAERAFRKLASASPGSRPCHCALPGSFSPYDTPSPDCVDRGTEVQGG